MPCAGASGRNRKSGTYLRHRPRPVPGPLQRTSWPQAPSPDFSRRPRPHQTAARAATPNRVEYRVACARVVPESCERELRVDGVLVGTVLALYRYPVKSMRGERIDATRVGWSGLAGDRRYAFVRGGNTSRFPWLTGREVPNLLRYAPYLAGSDDPAGTPVRVLTPDGADFAIEDASLLDELAAQYGGAVYLLQSGRGIPDSAAVSVIGAATIRDLGERVGATLDPIRFRQNILLETVGDRPYEEEAWLGGVLRFGDRDDSARIRLDRKDPRCMMVNLDPVRAVQNPAVLKEIVRNRDQCAGLYASTETNGTIAVGDSVRLLRA
jgi:uncharacterized protein